MSDPAYRALIERARSQLIERDEEVRKLKGTVEELTDALEQRDAHAELGRAIEASGKWFEVSAAAKELSIEVRRGKKLGPNQLYCFMRNTGLILRRRDSATGFFYHQPKQDQVDAGHMKLQDVVDRHREDRNGNYVVYRKTLISAKGVLFLRRKILEAMLAGILEDLIND